jgi:molybdopterin synthase catalytic subunit
MSYFTRNPLTTYDAEIAVADDSAGAIVSFVGTTRNRHHGKAVNYLEYEAGEQVANKVIEKLCTEACQKFNLVRVHVRHRLGSVEIGDASVVIAVSSGHRAAAFEGCRWMIDMLKTTVPIFKKEYYEDGTSVWVGPDGKSVDRV